MRRLPRLTALLCAALSALSASANIELPSSSAVEPLAAGRYALLMDVVADAEVPVLGSVRSSTRILALVDVAHEGEALRARQRVCDIRLLPEDGLARTLFPRQLLDSLPHRSFTVELSAHEEGTALRADLGVEALGYHPGLAAGLPASREDPRVIDSDRDGRPGATLYLEVLGRGRFPLEVVSRGRTVLEGQVLGHGRAAGRARLVEFQQHILGGLPVSGGVDGVRAVDEGSRFILQRVDGGLRCGDVRLVEGEFEYRVATR